MADLRLLDLTGPWPTRAGASMLLASGPRGRARDWSRQVYAAYPQIQGLWYPSSMHAHARSAALYERARAALPADLHPVAVYNWFTLPDPDLTWQGEPLSPLDWLRSGGDPAPAAAIAADL